MPKDKETPPGGRVDEAELSKTTADEAVSHLRPVDGEGKSKKTKAKKVEVETPEELAAMKDLPEGQKRWIKKASTNPAWVFRALDEGDAKPSFISKVMHYRPSVRDFVIVGTGVAVVLAIIEGVAWLMDKNGLFFKRDAAALKVVRRAA